MKKKLKKIKQYNIFGEIEETKEENLCEWCKKLMKKQTSCCSHKCAEELINYYLGIFKKL